MSEETKTKDAPQLLEEDDEFEEFPAEGKRHIYTQREEWLCVWEREREEPQGFAVCVCVCVCEERRG
jgi:hypothetical protein